VILDALTYNGSAFDTILNSVVLVVLIVALALQSRWPWRITFVGMAVVQVALWFGLGVTGISVVWSGLAGAALVELVARSRSARQRSTSDLPLPVGSSVTARPPAGTAAIPDRRWMLRAALVVAFAAIVYYAVALPPISTVAHLLAVVVGVGIQVGARKLGRRSSAPKAFQKESGPFRLPDTVHKKLLETWPDFREREEALVYESVIETGLLISRTSDGFRVERRPERGNTYSELRFETTSRRDLHRRLLRE
jgi:hypothetical protein